MPRQRTGDESVRARLVAAAQGVLQREGLPAVTVRRVAAEAGLSVGVLYNHFRDADDLVASALMEQLTAVGTDVAEGSASTDLAAYATLLLEQMRASMPIGVSLLSRPSLRNRIREHSGGVSQPVLGTALLDALLAAQRSGTIGKDVDVEGVVLGVTTLVHGVALVELFSAQPTSREGLQRLLAPYQDALQVKATKPVRQR
jgi:AcrR family transcriptional regulator